MTMGWGHNFTMDLFSMNEDELVLKVKSKGTIGVQFLGQLQIPIKALILERDPVWYYLTDKPSSRAKKTTNTISGELQIQLKFVHRLRAQKSTDDINVASPVSNAKPLSSRDEEALLRHTRSERISRSSHGHHGTSSGSSGHRSSREVHGRDRDRDRDSSRDTRDRSASSVDMRRDSSSPSGSPGTSSTKVKGGSNLNVSKSGSGTPSPVTPSPLSTSSSLTSGISNDSSSSSDSEPETTSHRAPASIARDPSKRLSLVDDFVPDKKEETLIDEALLNKQQTLRKKIDQQRTLVRSMTLRLTKVAEIKGESAVSQAKKDIEVMERGLSELETELKKETDKPKPKPPTTPAPSSSARETKPGDTISKDMAYLSQVAARKKAEEEARDKEAKEKEAKERAAKEAKDKEPSKERRPSAAGISSAKEQTRSDSPSGRARSNSSSNSDEAKANFARAHSTFTPKDKEDTKSPATRPSALKDSADKDRDERDKEERDAKRKAEEREKEKEREREREREKEKEKEKERTTRSSSQDDPQLRRTVSAMPKASEHGRNPSLVSMDVKLREMEARMRGMDSEKKDLMAAGGSKHSPRGTISLDMTGVERKLREAELDDEIEKKEEEKRKLEREMKKLHLDEAEVKRGGKEKKSYEGSLAAIAKKKTEAEAKIKALDKDIFTARKKKSELSTTDEEEKTPMELALDDRRANLTRRIKEIEENVEKQLMKKKATEIEVLEKKMRKMEKMQKTAEEKEQELQEAKRRAEEEDDEDYDDRDSRLVRDPSGTLVRRKELDRQENDRMEKRKKEMEDRMRELEDSIEKTKQERRQAAMRKKQKQMEAMEEKLKKMTQLAEKEKAAADEEPVDDDLDDDFLRPSPSLVTAVEKIDHVVTKLEKLDKLDELMRKLDTMSAKIGSGGFSMSSVESSGRSVEELRAELGRLEAVINDAKASEKDREDANIKYEKTFNELSQTDEYRRELAAIAEEKRRINEPLNKKALEKMLEKFADGAVKKNSALDDHIREHPELTLIGMDPRAILAKHQNDFQSYLVRGLETEELRAICASLPKFRNDQKKQQDWVTFLENKIDQQTKEDEDPSRKKRPAGPRPPRTLGPPKKAPAKKAPPSGDVFAELLARRKQAE
eukprot:TRINITY_DN80_c0_g1_i7.p1 TRINITY_DN80_c0_g1~~TRINITY_DN80_c0_g1_i7.p1  ORF type:complete len:1129 (-),score=468.23 TRINITY_DN80_c0_g1_i7:134-3520(-)